MRRFAATMAVIGTVASGLGGGVAAASNAPGAGPGFSIAAANSPRWFIFNARPGETVHGQLLLHNTGTQVRHIALADTDAVTGAAGGYAFSSQTPAHTGTWVSLARSTVTLPPGARTSVSISVRVPAHAAGGEHYAGITAVDEAQVQSIAAERAKLRHTSVFVLTRAGIAVQVNLPGVPLRRLAFTGAQLLVTPSGPRLVVRLANRGNRLIETTTVDLRLSSDGRTVFRSETNLGAFLTESSIAYLIPWRATLAPGRYRLQGWIRPAGASPVRIDTPLRVTGDAVRKLRQEAPITTVATSRVPIAMLIALGVAAVVIAGLSYALTRTRR